MRRAHGGPGERNRSAGLFASVVLLGGLVGAISLAGAVDAAEDRRAGAAAGVKKQLKQLKSQVAGLQGQINDLQSQLAGQAGSRPPSGPAGGDLTGSFPDPALAPDSVSSAEVASNSLLGADIDDDSLSLGVNDLSDTFTSPSDSSSPKLINYTCGASEELIGGSAYLGGSYTTGSSPTQTSNVALTYLDLDPSGDSVFAGASEIGAGTASNWTLTVDAVCADVSG